MREARTSLAVAGTLLLAGCGSTAAAVGTVTLTPQAGTRSVMECLNQESEKLGYQVIRIDREDGDMLAERRDKNPNIDNPREYAGGDQITVTPQKKQGEVQPLSLVPASFIMEWLVNGANQKYVKTSERAEADVRTLSERCRL